MVALKRRDYAILFLITALGTALRLYHLDAQSAWYDETFSIAYSARPLAELYRILIQDVVHPPLHYLVLHAWFEIVGYSAMQARLVSAIFGILSIPLLFLLARRFTDTAGSLAAAFLLAISQVGVYFSQEARPYEQALFVSLLAAIAFERFLRRPDWARTVVFAVAAEALIYTHYYGAATLVALGVFWIVYRREYPPLVFRRLAVAVALLVAGYLPWVIALHAGGQLHVGRVTGGASVAHQADWLAAVASLNRFNNVKFGAFDATTTLPQALLGIAVFTLPILVALWLKRSAARGIVFGCLLAAFPVLLATMLGAFGVIYNDRYYSFGAPGYYLAVAIGWAVCFRGVAARAAWLAVAAGICGLALVANQTVLKPDYRGALMPLANHYRAGDCAAGFPGRWYNEIPLAWEVYHRDQALRLVPYDALDSGLVPNDARSSAQGQCERLWVIWDKTVSLNGDPADAQRRLDAMARLYEHYDLVRHYERAAMDLDLLQLRPPMALVK